MQQVLKAIYAPHKAFREVIQNPKYYGPILIMVLFVAAFAGFQYGAASKAYDEQTLPALSEGDVWTENSTLWTSDPNVVVAESDDSLSGRYYYGNKSIEFSVVNGMQIWVQLALTEFANCSGTEGFKNMSFRIKPIYPDTTQPVNASISLFSDQIGYFSYNLTANFVLFTEPLWYNQTIPLGPQSGWVETSGSADWGNITTFGLRFVWSENANITVRIDGLVFRGVFKPLVDNAFSFLFDFSLRGFMQFIIEWVLLSGLAYVLIKAFRGAIVWKPLLILIGFSLIPLLIQAVISAVVFSTLPTIYRPLELFCVVEGEFEVAATNILNQIAFANQIYNVVQIAVFIWTIGLCALAIRLLTEFSLTKSFLIGSAAYFVGVIATSFMVG